MDSIEQ